jgi:hypothetical protein
VINCPQSAGFPEDLTMSATAPQIKAETTGARSAPRWRNARHAIASLAAPERQPPCPVAQMAEEAAQLLRLRIALGSGEDQQPDDELVEALKNPDYSVRADCLHRDLFERLRALKSVAGHRRPTSIKGVLFQLYVAAEYAQGTDGYLVTRLSAKDEQVLEGRDRQIERLNRAAIAQLESLFMDDDLAVLRDHYLPQRFDVYATCERAMRDRSGLIAELNALPSTWKEHAATD